MPDETGTWTYSYTWTDGTAGGSGSFKVVNTGKKGILKPYGANPHWFAYNGTDPVFLRSYYIITGGFTGIPINWAVSNIYQKILNRGYNHILLNMLPVAYTDQTFVDAPAHFSGTLYTGTNPLKTMDMAIWKRMEEHVGWLNDRDVGIHFFQGFDGSLDWKGFNGTGPGLHFATLSLKEKEFYVRYVVARLAPYANIAGWNYRWETPGNGPDLELARLLAQFDPWEHLRTYADEEPSSNNYWRPEYTFAAVENHGYGDRQASLSHHQAMLDGYENKPVYMVEGNGLWRSCWMDTWGGFTGSIADIERNIRRAAWGVTAAAGSFAWNDIPGCGGGVERASDIFSLQADEYLDVLYGVMANDLTFYRMDPRDDLITRKSAQEVWALAEEGRQYLVYSENGRDFDLRVANGTYSATWINTKTNTRLNANGGIVSATGSSIRFVPPSRSTDWVLLLKKSGTPPPPPTGTTFTNQNLVSQGKCLTAQGSTIKSNIVIDQCDGRSGQHWTYASSGELKNGTLCLDVWGAQTTSGTNLQLYTCHRGTNQQWTQSSSIWKPVSAPSLCMDIEGGGSLNGTNVHAWNCNGGSSQSWIVQAPSGTPPPPTPSGADINSDGKVDVTDLGILLSNWGASGSADINNDGKVDVVDLGILLSNWS